MQKARSAIFHIILQVGHTQRLYARTIYLRIWGDPRHANNRQAFQRTHLFYGKSRLGWANSYRCIVILCND